MGTSTFSEYTVVAEISVAKVLTMGVYDAILTCAGQPGRAARQGVSAGLRHLDGLRRRSQHRQCKHIAHDSYSC